MDWDALMPKVELGTAGNATADDQPPAHWEQFPPETAICSHLEGVRDRSLINELGGLFPLFPLFPPEKTRLGLEEQEKAPGVAGRPAEIRARKSSETVSPTDDLQTCRSCRNLEERVCRVARPGGLVSARRGYEPIADLLQRCRGYSPLPADPDQRRGIDRWPGL